MLVYQHGIQSSLIHFYGFHKLLCNSDQHQHDSNKLWWCDSDQLCFDESRYSCFVFVIPYDKFFVVATTNRYGLKQAPKAWFERLKSILPQFGFTNSKYDTSLLTYNTKSTTAYNFVYLDGAQDYFLGIEVHLLPNGFLLMSQSKYIKDF